MEWEADDPVWVLCLPLSRGQVTWPFLPWTIFVQRRQENLPQSSLLDKKSENTAFSQSLPPTPNLEGMLERTILVLFNICQRLPIFSWIKSKSISMACLAVHSYLLRLHLLFQLIFPWSPTNFQSRGASSHFLDHTLPDTACSSWLPIRALSLFP